MNPNEAISPHDRMRQLWELLQEPTVYYVEVLYYTYTGISKLPNLYHHLQ